MALFGEDIARLHGYKMGYREDEQGEIVFLHRVTPGSLVRSYGIHVAKMAGMPLSIVRRAREVLKDLEATKDGKGTGVVVAHNGQIHGRSLVAGAKGG